MFILVIITLTARYLHPRNGVLSWHIKGLHVWHVSDLPVVSRAGDKSPDDSNRDMSWRYEIFKWDANREGLCDAGCLMLMFSLEYKKSLCHFIWIKKERESRNGRCECEFFGREWQDNGEVLQYRRLCQSAVWQARKQEALWVKRRGKSLRLRNVFTFWALRSNSAITSTPLHTCVSWDLIWRLQSSLL